VTEPKPARPINEPTLVSLKAAQPTTLHPLAHTVVVLRENCMDAPAVSSHHSPVRVLPHIKRLDDCFGDFEAPPANSTARE